MDDAQQTIAMIHDAVMRGFKPFPPLPWWRRLNTAREMDIGENMYHAGATFVLREWEMYERRRARYEALARIEADDSDPHGPITEEELSDPFDVEPSREPDDG